MQGQLRTHACLGCLLYSVSVSVSVLYNVDTFICKRRFCNLVISQTFFAILCCGFVKLVCNPVSIVLQCNV